MGAFGNTLNNKKDENESPSSPVVSEKTKESASLFKRTTNRLGQYLKKSFGKKEDTLSPEPKTNTEYLGEIYKMLVQNRDDLKLEREQQANKKEENDSEEQKRHKEIIKALTLRRKPKPKRVIRREKKAEEKEAKKQETPKKPDEPKQPSKPTEPTKPAETPKQPTKPAEPAKPAEAPKQPTKPAEPAKPAEAPKQPAKPAEAPKQPAKPAEPAKPTQKPVEKPKTAEPVKETPKPQTSKPAEPVKPPEPKPSAQPAPAPKPSAPTAAVVTAATGITISANALASMKGEQNVHSAKEALAPVTDPKIAKSHGIPIGVGKIGAATPDVQNSTSYGLFGINNIRAKDKNGKPKAGSSSIDVFVKMSPELGLPTPGDPDDASTTKTFNEAWWKVSKEKPEDMLKAQLKFFKQKFEDPAVSGLKGLPNNIIDNPGVQLYMTDRRIQYGEALLQGALNYAKSAKTPEEFINLISEFDKKNLRVKDSEGKQVGIFRKTSDEDYAKIAKGLENRITTRKKLALEAMNSNVGSNLSQASQENKDMKNQNGSTSTTVNQTTTNVTNVNESSTPNKVDDRPPHKRK